mgnify:CR=1 FL=1
MNSAAAIINFFTVRYAIAPADKEHQFGHGEAEALAGLAQALLILVSIGLLLSQTLGHLWNPVILANTPLGISVMVFTGG